MPVVADKIQIVGTDGDVADVVGGILQTSGGGGGGGGGAVTVADGADVTQGAVADAVVAAGAAGTVSAKLRRLTTDLATLLGQTDTLETLLAGGLPAALGSGGGLKVDGSGTALPVSSATLATQATLASVLTSVDGIETLLAGGLPAALGGGGGLKVDGSGTALPVSSATLATAAKQPALGTAGTPSADVQSFQGTVASDAPVTAAPFLGGGRASTAVPTAVSADGDAVATWLSRNGAAYMIPVTTAGAAGPAVTLVNAGNTVGSTFLASGAGDGDDNLKNGPVVFNWARIYNGTSWDRLRTAVSDGQAATGLQASGGQRFNGTTWDRERGNIEGTLLASAARTVATSSADQINYNGRGVLIITNVTVEGANTLTLTVQGKDSISSNYYELITGIVVYTAATDAPPTTRAIALFPGTLTADAIGIAGATGMTSKQVVVPRTWRVTVTPGDATTTTYSVSVVTLI